MKISNDKNIKLCFSIEDIGYLGFPNNQMEMEMEIQQNSKLKINKMIASM